MRTPSAKEVIESLKKYRFKAAGALVILSYALRLAGPNFAYAALVTAALMMLPILAEIHEIVSRDAKVRTLPSFLQASPLIAEAIANHFMEGRPRVIRCLGVTLLYQSSVLDAVFKTLFKQRQTGVVVEITLIDPNWGQLETLNKKWPPQASAGLSALELLAQENGPKMTELGWSFNVYTYRYVPHQYGVMVGDDLLFLGTMYWENGTLHGGANPIRRIERTVDRDAAEQFAEFLSWFQYSKQVKIDDSDERVSEQDAAQI